MFALMLLLLLPAPGDACPAPGLLFRRACRQYSLGPCPVQQVLFPSAGGCLLNPCAGKGPGHVYWPPDGRCYRLGTTGPCPLNAVLNLHLPSLRPHCVGTNNNLATLPSTCSTSNANNCQKPVLLPARPGCCRGRH